MLVTWFTFLPSFVFILAGGPFIESTGGHLSVDSPLDCHQPAAVVGMIVQLALFFAFHTLVAFRPGWTPPLASSSD
jgi:chromate transporter